MTCAKKYVRCTIITMEGDKFVGTNDCQTPQRICPRLPNEEYEKCKTICNQEGHAEEVALYTAKEMGYNLFGATAYIEGISYFCKNCQKQLFNAGVKFLTKGTP